MALDESKTPMLKSAHSLQDWRQSVAGRVGTVTPETPHGQRGFEHLRDLSEPPKTSLDSLLIRGSRVRVPDGSPKFLSICRAHFVAGSMLWFHDGRAALVVQSTAAGLASFPHGELLTKREVL
jgi:hypothetical protein